MKLALAIIAGALAVWLALRGADFMGSLERRDVPIAKVETAGDPGTPRLAGKVYLVILDGLGYEHSHLPFFDRLRKQGVDAIASSQYPTWSRPNYVSILTGVPPPASGIRTNYHPMSMPLDSIMARAKAGGLRVGWVSDYPVIPPLFLGPGVVDLDGLDFDDRDLRPPAGYAWPFDDVRRRPTPAEVAASVPDDDLTIIVLGDVDRAGHLYGGASEPYADAARTVDRAIEQAIGKIDLARDAVIVVADHGHVDRGGHGGLEPEVVQVPMILAGAGVRAGAVPADAQLIDVAPTIAALLGVPAPQQALGRTLTGALMLSPDDATKREAADRARRAPIQRLLADEAEREDDAIATRRMWRIPLLVLGLVGFVVVARRHRVPLRLAPIAFVAVAFVFVAFTIMVHGQVSPSHVPPKDALIARIVAFVITGVLAQVAATAWKGRGPQALGLAWLALGFAVLPACLLHAVAPQADVPSPAMIVVIPACDLAGAAGCAAVALGLFATARFRRRP